MSGAHTSRENTRAEGGKEDSVLSTSKTGRQRHERGFSLVEMVITLAILAIVLGVVGQTVFRVQQSYLRTRTAVEGQNNARSALDLMTRLIRQAGNNPRNNPLVIPLRVQDNIAPVGRIDTIRIGSDWNPADGDALDPYEDVTFSLNAAAGQLMLREGAGLNLPFLENINGFEILCFDGAGNPIDAATATTVANAGLIVSVDLVLTTNVPEGPPVVFRSSATVRGRE